MALRVSEVARPTGTLQRVGAMLNSYEELPITTTGGYGHHSMSSAPNYGTTYQVPEDAGSWTRTLTNGYTFSLSGGVNISGILGIKLSVDDNYSTTHVQEYDFVYSDNHLCGSNYWPA